MKIRTQLILVFVLLAVVPLAGIVLYSYNSSLAAVRHAVEADAAELAEDMEARVAGIEDELNRRVERVSELPVWRRLRGAQAGAEDGTGGDHSGTVEMILSELGETAPFLRSLEFIPAAPESPATPETPQIADGPPPAPRAPLPPPPPPPGWSIELSKAMLELNEELSAELPEAAREQLLAGLRLGAEAARRLAMDWVEDAELKIEIDTGEPPDAETRLELRRRALEEHRVESRLHQQRRLEVPVIEEGSIVGSFRAQVSVGEVLYQVLSRTRRDQGEIPFAFDDQGELLTAGEEDRERLADLPLAALARGEPVPASLANWVVVTRQEPATGVTFGIARPIRESLEEVRATAVRNLGYGLALIGLALIGILPLSRRMTRGLQAMTAGAERIAQGDLDARVPVTSRNEIGQLATAFNRMAFDLKEQQEKLVEEGRRRRDQEVEQQLLQAEYQRKSNELEEARRFQLSLLPRELPRHPSFEVAVVMLTAAEVGGDYYDFRLSPDRPMIVAIGDATGHGAKAGTMVTVIKSLFSAYPPERDLPEFLAEANRTVRRMELGRMAMALCLARFEKRRLTVSSAGMPPVLVRRADGTVEEIAVSGMPLGGLALEFDELEVELRAGDTVLLLSDGLPELPNAEGEPMGYERVQTLVADAPAATPQHLIDALVAAAEAWSGKKTPADDITFVAVRVR